MTTTQPDKSVGVREFRQRIGEHLDDVLRGQRITVTRQGRKIARLLPYEEEPVSEEQAPYGATDLNDRLEALQRESLAGELAFNAYCQAHDDKEAAIRALAEAILKVQALP